MVSFIIPAHNEERLLGACLESIRAAMAEITRPFEVIVVDDASEDATVRIAEAFRARVLRVNLRNIAAVRNAGARIARGRVFFFVDADTRANAEAVKAALSALEAGASGGGCVPALEGPVPFWARVIHFVACAAGRIIRLTGGCFLFCTRLAFRAAGGFPESLHAGEDIAFVRALKKTGRFVIPAPAVVTSARKLKVVGFREVAGLMLRIALRGPRYDNPWVRDLLYGARARASRERD